MIFQHPHPQYKSIETQIWPCLKKIKVQPMIIIWTNLVEPESSMIYTKIQPQKLSWFWRRIFSRVLPYMVMAAILFNCAEPFEQDGNTLSTESQCEIWWKLLKQRSREEDIKKLHNFVHVYSLMARANNSQGTKIWLQLKCFTTLITNCKFQPLVLNTFWKNYFSTVYPYICLGMQIWFCRKKAKGPLTVIIWTYLVDLESSMLYTKVQPKSIFGSWEEDF